MKRSRHPCSVGSQPPSIIAGITGAMVFEGAWPDAGGVTYPPALRNLTPAQSVRLPSYALRRERNETPAAATRIKPSATNAQSCSVGIVAATGAAPTTTMLAEAVPPVPPSTDVTAPVVLIFVPAFVPVTFTLNVHEALPARVALVRLTLPEPAVAVITPPPQLPVSPFGVAITRPAGSVSVKPIPVRALAA